MHSIDDSDIHRLLEELIRIPSVNPTLSPGESQGEEVLASFAKDWLRDRGVAARLEEVAPRRPNLVAEVGGGDGPTLVLCGHIDTVSAVGMSIAPFEPRREGSRVFGRGAYDMKGGVAAAMAATAALADANDFTGHVLLALVVDEEHASVGADRFVAQHRADACIITEPTEGRLILKHKGFVWSEIVTQGVAAHGSRPDLGVSAIGLMGRVIEALTRFDRDVLNARSDPDLGPASLHPAVIEGGAGLSTYAPECRLKIERRTLPGETADQVTKEMRDLVSEIGVPAELSTFFHRTPLVCDPEEPIVAALRDAATHVIGRPPEESGVAYWTDAAIFDAAGIPALNYGPAGEGAHAAVEWVDADSVVNCARVLVETARRFCRGQRSGHATKPQRRDRS